MQARHVCCAFDFSGRWLRSILLMTMVGGGALSAQTILGAQTVANAVAAESLNVEAQAVTVGQDAEARLPDAPLLVP